MTPTPTDTDRFLAAVRAEALGGLDVAPADVLRLLRVIEEQGREVLRLRGTQPSPDEPETAPRGNPESDGVSDPESLRMRLRLAGRLIAHVEQHLASPVEPPGKRPEARTEGGMWVSCGLDGFTLHDTADEAREEAEAWLQECRERAPGGWPEETVGIMWGEVIVHGRVVEIEHRPRADGDPPGPWDEWVDYALRPVVRP